MSCEPSQVGAIMATAHARSEVIPESRECRRTPRLAHGTLADVRTRCVVHDGVGGGVSVASSRPPSTRLLVPELLSSLGVTVAQDHPGAVQQNWASAPPRAWCGVQAPRRYERAQAGKNDTVWTSLTRPPAAGVCSLVGRLPKPGALAQALAACRSRALEELRLWARMLNFEASGEGLGTDSEPPCENAVGTYRKQDSSTTSGAGVLPVGGVAVVHCRGADDSGADDSGTRAGSSHGAYRGRTTGVGGAQLTCAVSSVAVAAFVSECALNGDITVASTGEWLVSGVGMHVCVSAACHEHTGTAAVHDALTAGTGT